jgi:hypothetical protein
LAFCIDWAQFFEAPYVFKKNVIALCVMSHSNRSVTAELQRAANEAHWRAPAVVRGTIASIYRCCCCYYYYCCCYFYSFIHVHSSVGALSVISALVRSRTSVIHMTLTIITINKSSQATRGTNGMYVDSCMLNRALVAQGTLALTDEPDELDSCESGDEQASHCLLLLMLCTTFADWKIQRNAAETKQV